MDSSGNLSIKRYDPMKCPEHAVITVIAKRRSGKSFLVRDWLYQHRKRFFAGIVMSGTEEGNHFYEDMGVPKSFIYNDFNEDALTRLLERQRKLTKQGKAQPVFVVMDDVAYDSKIFKLTCIRQLLLNGRHWKIQVYICLQYMLDVPPGIRANMDLIIVLKDNLHRDKLYKTFFQAVPSIGMFNSIMDACTTDYKALILDNASNSTDLSECIYWYKSRDRKPFRIGHKIFYDFNEKRAKSDNEDQESTRAPAKKKKVIKLLK
jgi:hypothetical protein